MKNWFFFHHMSGNSPSGSHVNGKTTHSFGFHLVFASILIILGSWLILHILTLTGLSPFNGSNEHALQLSSFSPSVCFWEDDIAAWSEAWSLDPYLIATVIQIESCGNPDVVSNMGAQGLFQVMPLHFTEGEDMKAVQTNAARGLSYLKEAVTLSEGDIRLSLAGYNGGHSQIKRPAHLWPEETQRYVRWGSGIYQDAVSGDAATPTLDAWLESGGWYLCQLAEKNLNLPNIDYSLGK